MFTTRYHNELAGTYQRVMPTPLANPYWVGWNASLADQMGLPIAPDASLLNVMAGKGLFEGHEPIAQKYAGHQFGAWNPDLGDGRGLLLGEWVGSDEQIWEMHLKGAGATPFSRFGDGRAVLRSSIREFLGSEALHGLGIPTTRALALIGSSEPVRRETIETAATLLRVAKSHIRFGHFEWFAFSRQPEKLSQLIAYTIRHHFPDVVQQDAPILGLFSAVKDATAKMIAYWMAYGFCHGVMNTDNMSILGDTFDYGPFAFLDRTELSAVFNHTDQGGRYAFNQQPAVAFWNLQQLAQALATIEKPHLLIDSLASFNDQYKHFYYQLMNKRLGGAQAAPIDQKLIDEWLAILEMEGKDFHIEFRKLAELPVQQWFKNGDNFIDRQRYLAWCSAICTQVISDDSIRQQQMLASNPVTVARSHHLQTVIDAAQLGNMKPFESFFAALQSPFEIRDEWQVWQNPPKDNEMIGELSCSS